MKRMSKATLFILITFGINYSMVGLFLLFGIEYKGVPAMILGSAYMFIPLLSAFLVSKIIHKEKIKKTFLLSFKINKWYVAGWLLFPVLAFGTLGVTLMLPGMEFAPEMSGMMERFEDVLSPEQLDEIQQSIGTLPFHPIWMALLQGLIAGATINAVFAFGEEAGWRGYLLYQWRHMNFWKVSLITGFIWGIWHAPLILMGHNYPQHPQLGVGMMVIWCILLSPIFTYFTIRARSVIVAAVMHGTLNASVGIPIMVVKGGNDLTTGMTGLPGFITLAVAILILVVYDRKISGANITRTSIAETLQ